MEQPSPPDDRAFFEAVWALAREVPRGSVATYGQIARLLAPPAGVTAQDYTTYGSRWVGGAMAACPDDVPWHRVVNAQGKISQRPGARQQRQRLESEQVPFVGDRIDLRAYQWRGPEPAGDPAQGSLF